MKTTTWIGSCLILMAISCGCSRKEETREPRYISIGYVSSVIDHPLPVVIISTYQDDAAKMPYTARGGDMLILTEPKILHDVETHLREIARIEKWTQITDPEEHKNLLQSGFHAISLNNISQQKITYRITKDQEIDALLRIAHRIVNSENRFENFQLLMLWIDREIAPDTKSWMWSDLTHERYRKVNFPK